LVSQRLAILLEQGTDSGKTTIPTVLQILESQTPVLSLCLLPHHRVFRPDSGRVLELGLPRDDVSEQVGDQVSSFVRQTGSEVTGTALGLLGPSQVGLGDQDETHRKLSETTQLFGRVEQDRRESTRHLRVQTDLDSGLNLVLGLDQHVEQLRRSDDTLSVVGDQGDDGRVPLVGDLGVSCRT